MSWSWKAGIAGAAILATTAYGAAQMSNHPGMQGQTNADGTMPPQGGMTQGGMNEAMHARMMQMMQQHNGAMPGMPTGMQGGMQLHGMMTDRPTLAGQDAFGAIAEVVQMLQSDPATDWSKVNIGALREHLIDMNEVTLHAVAVEQPLDDGITIAVTGEGRTAQAIKRMVPAHAAELNKIGWSAKTEELPNGVMLTVTTADPKEVVKLKALGFIGIMVLGQHHLVHHLLIAKGDLPLH
jgi:hypothetical protein